MKQHLLTLFLALAASVAPLFAQSGTCGGNLTWTLDTESGTLTISGTGAMKDYNYGSNGIPNTPWYSYRSSIKTVKIGSSVTSIGEMAFYYCSSLTSVTIPNSVTSIGERAFYLCSNLTSITIPNSVTSIGGYALSYCSGLTSIIVASGNTTYDSRNNCNAIIETATNMLIAGCKTTIIPNSVTSIGDYAFNNCSSLTSITIPNSVTSIGYDAFSGCSSLTSVTIPNSVTSIGDWAFSYCSGLTSITIPNSVTSIESSAFYGCSSLTSITIPNSVTSIGYDAFSGCSSLTSIIVASGNTTYDSRNNCNAIIETATNTLIAGCQATTIPNSVTSIGNYAFSHCSNLTSITIPNSVTNIGNDAFYWCSSLTSITIPNSVTSIGIEAFMGCWRLTSIDIPNSVTSIGGSAFYKCSSLTSITIPNSVTSIGDHAFYNCSKLTSITIPNSVATIGDYAFYYCSSLTSITIPINVTSIGDYAFYECLSLTSVTIPNSVTSIGDYAFYGCTNLNTITILNSITSIGNYAFYGCSNLTSATIGNGITNIGNYAFYGCSSLTSITIGNSVTSIGSDAFYGCSSLTSITIGNSVTSIGGSAFSYCSSLTSVTIPNSVTSIGDGAFEDCSSLTSVTIPNSVTSIGVYAFGECSSLTSITIPNSVTSIGVSVFSGCTSLTSIICEAVTPPTWVLKLDGMYIVNEIDNSIPLYVPAQSIGLYKSAEEWKDFTNILPITSSTPQTFTITFLNYDGSELQSSELEAGTMPQYNGITPTKPADAQYTYTFAGWDKEVVAVTGDATYTAVFVSVVQCGTIETTDGITVWEDQLPYTWEGISFTTAGTETKTLQASDGCDSTVTFTLRVRYHNITLQENEDADYYTQLANDYNGVTVTTATLNRQFTQGKWATLCLPFNVNKALMTSLGLHNRVFELRYAEKEDDSAFSIFFAPAQSIEAGKGYIVNPNAKLAAKTSFVFPNVTINTDSDNGDITALTGYNDGTNRGNLYLVGTLRTGILQGSTTGNTWLGLKDNQLYYPNSTSGTPMRAYRAVFRNDIPVNASRLRIIADGETVTELQVMNGEEDLHEAPSARKYIRNGILFIERNGVTYTAQGQRID